MRRLLVRRDESGVTVTEVVIVMLIFSLITLVLFDFLDRTTLLTARADAAARAEDSTKLALRVATDNIRGGRPFAPCASDGRSPSLPNSYADCLTATVSRNTTGLDTCPKTVFVYAVVGRQLVENRTDYTGSGTSCTAATPRLRRVLLADVINTNVNRPLFEYFDKTGALIPANDTARVPKASSIRMTLRVQYRNNAPALVMTSLIAPRNSR